MGRAYAAWQFNEYESDAFAEYLEQKAQEGWHLKKIGSVFLRFEKGESCRRRFFVITNPWVSAFESGDSFELRQYGKRYEEEGWTLQYAGQYRLVFYTEDMEKPLPDPDPEWLRRMKRRSFLPSRCLSVCILVGLVIWIFRMQMKNYPERFLTNNSRLLLFAVMALLAAMAVCELVVSAFWYRSAGRQLSSSGRLPRTCFSKVRRRTLIRMGVILGSVALILLTGFSNTAGRLAALMQGLTTVGICGFVLWWVRERGEGTGRERAVAYFVGALVLGFAANMLLTGVWMRISLFQESGPEPSGRIMEYPVNFASYGYEPRTGDFGYLDADRSFLAAFQQENLGRQNGRTGTMGQEVLQVKYYTSPYPAVISVFRDSYPYRWMENQGYELEQGQEKGIHMDRYHFTEYTSYDLFLLYDDERLLVLDFSDVPDEALLREMAEEFAER